MSTKYGLHGSLQAKEGCRSELLSILLQAAKALGAVEGCQLYLVSLDSAQPNHVWVTEVWNTQSDHHASLQNTEVRELIAQAMPLLDDQPSGGQQLDVQGGLSRLSNIS